MNSNGALKKFLNCFERYYNVFAENVAAPFVAEAVFKSHNEQYFLVKAAKIADIDSNEFVFFYAPENDSTGETNLSYQSIENLSKIAWERGLERVAPYYGHRNTDISLVVFADKIDEEVFRKIKKIKFYKSYKFGFYGWSAFRLMVYETSTGRAVANHCGSDLKKLVNQNSWAKAS